MEPNKDYEELRVNGKFITDLEYSFNGPKQELTPHPEEPKYDAHGYTDDQVARSVMLMFPQIYMTHK